MFPGPEGDGAGHPRTFRTSTLVASVVIAFGLGCGAGVLIAVVTTKSMRGVLRQLVAQEEKPEVGHTRSLERQGFTVQYPSNWHVDVDAEDYDPDHKFSIDSPGSAFVMFMIGSGTTNPEDVLRAQLKTYDKLLGSHDEERFARYGAISGVGAALRGRFMALPLTVRIFVASQEDRTLVVVQHCPDEDADVVRGGMSLIESTFALKPGAEAR